MRTMRVIWFRTMLVIILAVLALPVHFASQPAHAQGGDLQVWVITPTGDYSTWQIDYRTSDGQTVASYTLPGLPLQFDTQSAGRFAGSSLDAIVLFDPRVGQVNYATVPDLPPQGSQTDYWYNVTSVALASDGRYAYNLTRQHQLDYEQPAQTTLYVASPGAGDDRAIITLDRESAMAVQALRWRADDGALLVYDMPQGIGGYILFWTYRNVYSLDVATGQMTFIGDAVDGYTEDFLFTATMERDQNYLPTAIAVTDFTTNAITRYEMPALPEIPQAGGGAIFSPDHSKVAYQVARSNPEQEKFWTIVVDLLAGTSSVVYEEEAVGWDMTFGAIGGWLDNNTLAIGNYWRKDATSVLVDVTTGTVLGQASGAFAGYAAGVTSAAGFVPSGPITVACPGAPATRLTLNGRGRIAFSDGTMTNVRDYAGTDSNKIAAMPEGSTFTVLQGPTCAEGYAWWDLRFDNAVEGWVAEGTFDGYWLEPWQ